MTKVYAPNRGYTGISAGVPFVNGIGATSDPWALAWLESKGYTLEPERKAAEGDLGALTVKELRELAQEQDIKGTGSMRKAELVKALEG